jgi:DnaJ family protein C protein 2
MTALNINIVPLASLDWPDTVPKGRVQCGTGSFLAYKARKENKISFLHYSSFNDSSESVSSGSCADMKDVLKSKNSEKLVFIDLNKLPADELEDLSFYDVLGGIKMHSTPEQIKRAFHKACLKYHPDKEGANKESKEGDDPVFLKVKEAFETLSDAAKKKAYDSTADFDDSFPSASDVMTDSTFYKVFGEIFERNLRFAAENDPDQAQAAAVRKKKNKKGKNSKKSGPMVLGDDNTSISEVHDFYDYWVKFQSWRDYTLAASKVTEHDTELAGDRYEKRWMEKEIGRKAKAMKKEEMARITKMVERAMSMDPRLKREKLRVDTEKKEKARMLKEKKEKDERELKEREEREAKESAEREVREREEKATMKVNRDKEKKKLRKSRQALRRLVLAEYQTDSTKETPTWTSIDDVTDDIESLCENLSALEIDSLTSEVTDSSNLQIVVSRANDLRDDTTKAKKAEERERNLKRIEATRKEAAAKAARAAKPWTKEELAALVKAVKKYPAGGANRWEAIALFVNNLLKLEDPRRKEECIEKYNQVANSTAPATKDKASDDTPKDASEWTEDQDKQLQAGLAQYPSSMDKNERWSSIAEGVPGQSKKECVARFKAIREALKHSK